VEAALESGLAALEADLERLEARGARVYDGAACDCVRALLEHAEQLAGDVGARLEARAAAHLQVLSERFERDRRRIAGALQDAERACGELPELRRRLESGELTSVARALRKLRVGAAMFGSRASTRAPKPGSQTVARLALGRVQDSQAERRRRQVAYEDSVAQLVASLALARATDGVPDGAGPYNPLRIASEVLDRMRMISPFYLTVQLNRLEELASLLNLPELPAPAAEKVLPKRRNKNTKR
jgi:hypothetical protein